MNGLSNSNGYAKLTDFGFAKIIEWTLGILIYEMICGQPPFCDEDPMGIYQKILAGKVYFPKYFDKNANAGLRERTRERDKGAERAETTGFLGEEGGAGAAKNVGAGVFQSNGYAKLTDFGFAKIIEWTLGILIYEMICGQPPFCDEDPMGIYQKILAGKVYFPKYFDKNANAGLRERTRERDKGLEYHKSLLYAGTKREGGLVQALVKKLLVADLSKRFGNLKDGPADMLKQKWFESYELSKLETFEVPDKNDTSNYEDIPDFKELPATVNASQAGQVVAELLVSTRAQLYVEDPSSFMQPRRCPLSLSEKSEDPEHQGLKARVPKVTESEVLSMKRHRGTELLRRECSVTDVGLFRQMSSFLQGCLFYF
ncbi:cAMP-dependent protein kinase catalytic subunit PRKX [Symbiodinium microadriaticum]|uniref:cAMP-dependent protein kinase catalytic subunit PRKX n=1 Tax=Symbiodinium microadriaticum TaxID=2951 RepID=A0A1Q9BZU1_SYMMI|nr:cAMP-dependent protein kinase catalytic subunit PRKX [Symbiodinium microadriaticum]